jgi:cyanate permease
MVGLLAFSAAREPWQAVASWWLLIGPAGAMTYYEPAFIAVDQWFSAAYRARALAVLTVIGGISGTVFLPVTERLVTAFGWRTAAIVLGVTLAVVGVVVAVVFLPGGGSASVTVEELQRFSVRSLTGDRRFVLYTAGMLLSFGTMQSIITHRVARFEEAGLTVAAVAAWAAAASLISLPGRYVSPYVVRRIRPTTVHAAGMLLLTASIAVAVDVAGSWQMPVHFTMFGIAFGAMLPLRAMVMGSWFSGPRYGRIMGVQWTVAAVIGAVGPAAIGALRDALDGYRGPMAVLAVAMLAAAAATYLAGRMRSPARNGE